MLTKKINVLFVLLLFSCASSEKYYRHQLYRQRLVVRKNYPGKLTNQTCLERDGDKCVQWKVLEYDLKDADFRKKVNDFRIVCKIGGKRWRICLKKAGYCRRICTKKKWLSKKCKKYKEKYIPASDHQYLYDAGTVCKTYLTGGSDGSI